MGNCLRVNNKISAQEEKHDPCKEVETAPMPLKESKAKKTVRFDLQEVHDGGDDKETGGGVNGGDSKSGAVRIRLVVTQEELKQLLSYTDDSNKSCLEELLSAVKSRGRRGSQSDESVSSSGWTPTLESIPENQC